MTTSSRSSRTGSIAGAILIFLPGLAMGVSGILKFAGVPGVVHTMALAGFTGGRLILVAALELASAALFLYRPTRSFGILLLSAFLGGAICTHVQMGEIPKAAGPAVILAMAWIGTWLQHPEMLWSVAGPIRSAGRENVGAGLASREA